MVVCCVSEGKWNTEGFPSLGMSMHMGTDVV